MFFADVQFIRSDSRRKTGVQQNGRKIISGMAGIAEEETRAQPAEVSAAPSQAKMLLKLRR